MNLLSLKMAIGLLGTSAIAGTIPRNLFPLPASSFDMTARNPGDLLTLRRRDDSVNTAAIKYPGGTPLGKLYTINTTISGADYEMVAGLSLETSWIVDEKWQCYSAYTLEKLPHSDCRFGKQYPNPRPSDFQQIPNEHLNITYGDLTFSNGPVGTVHAKLVGLEFQPVIGVAVNAAWIGYGTFASGIVGFATGSNVDIYSGDSATTKDTTDTLVPHDTFLTTIFKQNPGVPQILSLVFGPKPGAIDSAPDGTISIGGVPDVAHDDFVKTPLINSEDLFPGYNLNVDSVTVNGKVPQGANVPTAYNLDTFIHPYIFPESVMNAILDTFSERPTFDEDYQGWLIADDDCKVKLPTVEIQIAGKKFEIPTQDLLNEFVAYDDGSTACIINAIGREDGPILGSLFMENLVTVIDLEAQQVSFANKK